MRTTRVGEITIPSRRWTPTGQPLSILVIIDAESMGGQHDAYALWLASYLDGRYAHARIRIEVRARGSGALLTQVEGDDWREVEEVHQVLEGAWHAFGEAVGLG